MKVTVQGLFDLDQDIPAFKEHLRDFMVQIKVCRHSKKEHNLMPPPLANLGLRVGPLPPMVMKLILLCSLPNHNLKFPNFDNKTCLNQWIFLISCVNIVCQQSCNFVKRKWKLNNHKIFETAQCSILNWCFYCHCKHILLQWGLILDMTTILWVSLPVLIGFSLDLCFSPLTKNQHLHWFVEIYPSLIRSL